MSAIEVDFQQEPRRKRVTQPWPDIRPELRAGVEVIAARLVTERGTEELSVEWERHLLERVSRTVQRVLASPTEYGFDRALAVRLADDAAAAQAFRWGCFVRSSLLWPLSRLVYGRPCEEIRRGAGVWAIETHDQMVRLEGGEPEEFTGETVREADKKIVAWLRRTLGTNGVQGPRTLTESTPIAEASFPTPRGPIRFAVCIEPGVTAGFAVNLTIRVIRVGGPRNLAEAVSTGEIRAGIATLLSALVQARLNIVITGNPGVGKTTLLRILAGEFDPEEWIATAEDVPELSLASPLARGNLPWHELTYPFSSELAPSKDATAPMTLEDTVRHILRHNPHRLIFGEARGGEMADGLEAMTSGQQGSLISLHAMGGDHGLERIEYMAAKSQTLRGNEKLARRLIHQAVHVVVHMVRTAAGVRRIDSVVCYSSDGAAKVIYATGEDGSMTRQAFTLEQLPQRIREALSPVLSEIPEP